MVYVHETSFGLDAAISSEGTGKLVLGYDRDTYSIVPRKGDGQEAMALVSLGCIYASGLDEVNFKHLVSTGTAAKNLARKTDVLEQINLAIQGRGNKCAPEKN